MNYVTDCWNYRLTEEKDVKEAVCRWVAAAGFKANPGSQIDIFELNTEELAARCWSVVEGRLKVADLKIPYLSGEMLTAKYAAAGGAYNPDKDFGSCPPQPIECEVTGKTIEKAPGEEEKDWNEAKLVEFPTEVRFSYGGGETRVILTVRREYVTLAFSACGGPGEVCGYVDGHQVFGNRKEFSHSVSIATLRGESIERTWGLPTNLWIGHPRLAALLGAPDGDAVKDLFFGVAFSEAPNSTVAEEEGEEDGAPIISRTRPSVVRDDDECE